MLLEQKQQIIQASDSAVTYAAGCGLAFFSWICDFHDLWQGLALFLGCMVVFVKLLHDSLRLYRSFMGKDKKK